MKLEWKFAKGNSFENVPNKAGVYIISTKQTDDTFIVKYVGKASDLKSRADQHWSENEENKELKHHIAQGYYTKFSYAQVGVEEDRSGIELYLYNLYNPKYNKNSPSAKKEIEVNTPIVRKGS